LLSAESLKAMEAIDGLVKKIVDATESARMTEETTFILVSDSGASKVEKEFNPNVLLAKKGWLTSDGHGRITSWRAGAEALAGGGAAVAGEPKKHNILHERASVFPQH